MHAEMAPALMDGGVVECLCKASRRKGTRECQVNECGGCVCEGAKAPVHVARADAVMAAAIRSGVSFAGGDEVDAAGFHLGC